MWKKLMLLTLLLCLGSQVQAQKASFRFGTMPYQWLWRQGVPGFVEFGFEYAPHERWSVIGHYKLLDDSMRVDRAWERPANEFSIQSRFYFSLEDYNSGAFISSAFSYARHWNYIAVNAIDFCEVDYYQRYFEYSLFVGYKLPGRLAFEFFGGPSWRKTDFFFTSTCGANPGVLQTADIRRKILLELGIRASYRLF